MSTTQSVELTDLELFLLADFEFEIPCDGRPHITTCDHAAVWEVLLECGCTRLWCDEHRTRAREWIAAQGMTCSTCHHATGVWTETTILYVQPLTKGLRKSKTTGNLKTEENPLLSGLQKTGSQKPRDHAEVQKSRG